MKGVKNLTEGSILKNSIVLSWPLLISYLLQVTISLVDIKMVSVLGTEVIAGVGLAQQFIMLAFLIFTAVSVGASIHLAQYTGREDILKVRETIIQTILLSIFIGVVLCLLGVVTIHPMLRMMNDDKRLVQQAYTYASITFYFAPVLLLNFTMNSIFRATGDSKTPLFIMVTINLLNVLFNYLLIYGIWVFPRLEVAGAAIGTGLSRSIGVAMGVFFLYRRELLFKIRKFRDIFRNPLYAPRFAPMRKIFVLGLPSSLQDISWSIAMLVIFKVLSSMPESTKAISAFSIAFNVEAFCFMPGIAFMQAATVMVGQHFGAGHIQKAEKAGWLNTLFGASFMGIIGFLMLLFPSSIVSFFTDDKTVIGIGKTYLTLMGSTQFFIGVKFIIMGALNGAGDTKIPFYAELAEHWVFRIPVILLLVFSFGYGTTAVWAGMAASNVINAVVIVLFFKNGYWKKLKPV